VGEVARSETERGATGGRGASSPRPEGEVLSNGRAPDPLIGKVIADRYRIVGHVGRGGMGVVYKVEHLRIGKLMAMKLLTGELSRNRDVVRRFKREALAASRLTSINTVQVWDFGHSDGLTYLVMELVAGEDFGKLLKAQGPLPFNRVAKIAVQVCNSLIEAHARGIVHRDLKPENLLILETGGSELQDLVKVLDFGLAKLHEDDNRPNPNDITTTGAIVGTPYYMAPEQIRGEAVDGRADLYALGAVMYRAITGTPPFTASNPMAVLTQHLTEELVPPHERAPELAIPPEASDLIAKAMAKAVDDRWESAVALRDALITYLAKSGISGGFLRTGSLEAVAAHGTADATEIAAGRGPSFIPAEVPATRNEVVAYTQRSRRNAKIAIAGGLVALALVAWGVRTVKHRASAADARPTNEELEPNDSLSAASQLTLGAPMKGYLGKRIGPEQGDIDVYSIDIASGDDAGLVEIQLGALPNIPLCLEVIDGEGAAPLGTFCRPMGQSLRVAAFAMKPGRHYLRVSQDRAALAGAPRPPVYENVSDQYSLRVALASRTPDLEIEPNDTQASGQSVPLGASIAAHLGWAGDRDVFCASGNEGAARFVVTDRSMKSHAPGATFEIEPLGAGAGAKTQLGPGSTLPQQPGGPGTAALGGGPNENATFTGPIVLLGKGPQCVAIKLANGKPAPSLTPSAIVDDGAYVVTLEKM
jgi:eukaryotic-like serine/threonine-protein kinase